MLSRSLHPSRQLAGCVFAIRRRALACVGFAARRRRFAGRRSSSSISTPGLRMRQNNPSRSPRSPIHARQVASRVEGREIRPSSRTRGLHRDCPRRTRTIEQCSIRPWMRRFSSPNTQSVRTGRTSATPSSGRRLCRAPPIQPRWKSSGGSHRNSVRESRQRPACCAPRLDHRS